MNNIYPPIYKLVLFIGVLVISFQSEGQVSTRDSLALVSLYSSTTGTQWSTSTNWLHGNVGSWYGIGIGGGRVIRIILPNNNLSGAVSDSIANLDSLKRIDLSGNNLTAFPALTGHLDSLSLQGNALTFKDLVPNKTHTDSFYYAPQDSADVAIDTTVVEQTSVSLKALVDYNPLIGDSYHWYKGSTSIVTSASNTYTITCMDSSQAGVYYCAITNGALPRLTIDRRAITVNVSRLANPGTDFHVCDTNSTLQGVIAAGDSVIWSTVSGTGVIASPHSAVTAVTGLSIGANVFKYSVSSNNPSCGSAVYSTALVTVTRDTLPPFTYAGPDQSVCAPQAVLSADSPAVGMGTWTVTRGSAIISQPNNPASVVNDLVAGQNIFRWQITNGACVQPVFDEIIVYRDDTLTSAYAGADTSICPTSYVLTSALPADASWTWSVVAGSGTFASSASTQTFLTDTTVMTPVSGLSEYLNTFKWTVSNTCNSVSADVNVTVYEFTVANAGPDQTIYYSPINAYTLGDTLAVGSGGNGQYSYVWAPASNIDSATTEHPHFLTPDAGTFTYSVTVTDGHGCTASAEVTYTVLKKDYLAVPTLFTPNGDGVNDVLYIPGIESYPSNELTVADRNDQVVYKKSGYTNDWGGINELGFSGQGSKLPADTYYYTLKLEDGRLVQTGFFLIKY